jgi:hypothetical protein
MIRTPIYSDLQKGPGDAATGPAPLNTVMVPGVGKVRAVDGNVILSGRDLATIVTSGAQDLPRETRETLAKGTGEPVAGGTATGQKEAAREPVRDDYLTKVVKYVPGEVLVAFLGIVAAASALDANSRDTALWIVFFMGLIATIGYYFLSSYHQETKNRAAPYFFVLAPVSFFVWVIAISGDMRELFSIGDRMSELILIGGAFAIPFLDEILTLVFTRFHKRIPRFMQIPALVVSEREQASAQAPGAAAGSEASGGPTPLPKTG